MITHKQLEASFTKVTINNTVLYFSYRTLVAMENTASNTHYKTTQKYSTTTSRHMNRHLIGFTATDKSIETLVNESLGGYYGQMV